MKKAIILSTLLVTGIIALANSQEINQSQIFRKSANLVTSVFGRTGDVVAQTNDYSFSQISGTVAPTQLPTPTATTLGGVESLAAVTHQFLTSIGLTGAPTQAQPACADLTGAAASCGTNASELSSGTVASARGGAGSISGTLKGNGSGVVSQAALSDSTGTLQAGQMPALTGDITTPGGSLATTLKNTGPGVTSCTTCSATIDAQGRVTALSTGAGSSGLTLISTVTASNSADLHWTGLSTTNNYKIICYDLMFASTGTFSLVYGTGAGPTYQITGYTYFEQEVNTSTVTNNATTTGTAIDMTGLSTPSEGVGQASSFEITITGAAGAARKWATWTAGLLNNSAAIQSTWGRGYNGSTTALTAFKLIWSGGNINSGACSLFSFAN